MLRRTFLIALIALAACGGDSSTGPLTQSLQGIWDMKSINGTPLPYTFPAEQGTTVTITGSVLTITGSGSGTYTDVLSYRLVSGATTANLTSTELGTWTANGGAITFSLAGNQGAYQGSVTGNTLTEIVDGITQVYQRR